MEPTNCSHPISKETYVHIWKDTFSESRNPPKQRFSECFRSGDAQHIFWRQINWSCIRSRKSRVEPCIQEKQPVININANYIYINIYIKTRWNSLFHPKDDYDLWYEKRLVYVIWKETPICDMKRDSYTNCSHPICVSRQGLDIYNLRLYWLQVACLVFIYI